MAGPIQYAPHWQDEALSHILGRLPNAFIATPREVSDPQLKSRLVDGPSDREASQRPWEKIQMRRAFEGQNSCLVFWLAAPTDIKDDGIGKMTRLELGETIATIEVNRRFNLEQRLSVVFGGHEDFPYLSTICIDLAAKAGIQSIHNTLADTCDAAIEVALANS